MVLVILVLELPKGPPPPGQSAHAKRAAMGAAHGVPACPGQSSGPHTVWQRTRGTGLTAGAMPIICSNCLDCIARIAAEAVSSEGGRGSGQRN